jgi:tetratricopeptide (TPR) repeat protein
MPWYLISSRPPFEKRSTQLLKAERGHELVETLLQAGHQEITLHDDDIAAVFNAAPQDGGLSPADLYSARFYPGSIAIAWIISRMLYRAFWPVGLALSVLLFYRQWEGYESWYWDVVLGLMILAPLGLGIVLQLLAFEARAYTRLSEAYAWARWDDVLAVTKEQCPGVAPFELDFRHAVALAARGELTEALELVAPYRDSSEDLPAYLYWSRLAEVYQYAKRPQERYEAMRQAAELAPDNPTVLLDLVLLDLTIKKDTSTAAARLAEVQQYHLSEMLQILHEAVSGHLALETGDAATAAQKLTQADHALRRFRHATPLVGLIRDILQTYLALAEAELGQTQSARSRYQKARPRLVAHEAQDLLARADMALLQ